jgi:hypothetical protein
LVEISGIVIPVDWDQTGRILAAAIATNDEDEYRIDEREKGRKLLQFINKNVQVSGEVREEEGRKIINVKQYRLQKKRRSESI